MSYPNTSLLTLKRRPVPYTGWFNETLCSVWSKGQTSKQTVRLQRDWERNNAKNLIMSLNKSVVCPDLEYYIQLWLSCLKENVSEIDKV